MDFDHGLQVQDGVVPRITSRSICKTVDLRSGQTLVMSGLRGERLVDADPNSTADDAGLATSAKPKPVREEVETIVLVTVSNLAEVQPRR